MARTFPDQSVARLLTAAYECGTAISRNCSISCRSEVLWSCTARATSLWRRSSIPESDRRLRRICRFQWQLPLLPIRNNGRQIFPSTVFGRKPNSYDSGKTGQSLSTNVECGSLLPPWNEAFRVLPAQGASKLAHSKDRSHSPISGKFLCLWDWFFLAKSIIMAACE
jgi:hypothetical protein